MVESFAEATDIMEKREGANLRRELDGITRRRGRCIAADLKARVSSWLVREREGGATVAELSTELGLSSGTVLKWSKKAAGVRALVPVRVVGDDRSGAVSIVSPSGYRLEGLSVVEASTLLRALG